MSKKHGSFHGAFAVLHLYAEHFDMLPGLDFKVFTEIQNDW